MKKRASKRALKRSSKRASKRASKRVSKRASKRTSRKYRFGTEDRRTIHYNDEGPRTYNVSTQFPGGILMAQNAFNDSDPEQRALDAGI
jgi:hypothetical protein